MTSIGKRVSCLEYHGGGGGVDNFRKEVLAQ